MAHDTTHITILMGTRNGGAFLRQQLASIAAQEHQHWSLWISDDGSTDATRSEIHAFASAQYNPVVLVSGPGQGPTANYLSLMCHPDLPPGPVAFADQNDLWLPTHLGRGLAALSLPGAPETGRAYVANRLPVSRSLNLLGALQLQSQAPGFRNALVENVLTGNAVMLDSAAVALVRRAGVVEAPFWDWWLYVLLSAAGAEIQTDSYPGVLYRAHEAAQIGPRRGLRAAAWRVARVADGSYRGWVEANLRALETHQALLTPAAQECLTELRALSAPRRMRRLSPYRQRRPDRVAVWALG